MRNNLALTPQLRMSNLFKASSQQFIADLASKLPMVSGLILESRLLKPQDSAADMSFRFLRHANEFFILADLCSAAVQESSTEELANWQRISLFVDNCIRNPEYAAIETIWLEFDEGPVGNRLPTPGLFFSIDQQCRQPTELISTGLSILRGVPTGEHIVEAIKNIAQVEAYSGAIHYTGVFLSRSPRVLRLTAMLPASELRRYASLVRADIEADLLQIALRLEQAGTEQVVANFNIANAIEFAGIEVKDNDKLTWAALLTILYKSGWADALALPDLLQWPGASDSLNLLDSLDCVSLEPKECRPHYFVRRINHVKLQLSKEKGKTAKVYLYEGYGWKKCLTT